MPNAPVLTPSQENYMEWIYRFSLTGSVKIRDVAKKLGVRLPSVSRAVNGLRQLSLVEHTAYRAVDLTDQGRQVGEAIVRRDTCLTRLLVDILGMSEADADPAVHQMEHVLTQEVLERLEVLVDFCSDSPHVLEHLTLRLGRLHPSPASECPQVGATNVHAGFAREKGRTPA